MKNQQIYNKVGYQDKLISLGKLKKTCNRFLRWDKQNKDWKKSELIKAAAPLPLNKVKTVSFNILFDREHLIGKKGSMEHVLNSRLRYAFILQQINKMQPDIVALQQVTPLFFVMLLQCPWAKQLYWVSDFMAQKTSFGNLLLSKYEPICLESIKVKRLPRLVQTGFFAVQNQLTKQINIITFSSVHLIALDKNYEIRKIELNGLMEQLKLYNEIVEDNILQGDMNFHAQFQTQNAFKLGLRDCWLERYNNDLKQYPGFTFDASKNSLINQLYWGFQRRRMRLDRIFYYGEIVRAKQINICFNNSVYEDKKEQVNHHFFLKGGFLYASDYFGFNFRRQKQKYLFPSDHFGLIAQLQFNFNKDKQID